MHRRRQPHLEDLPGFLGPKVPALSQDLVQKALSGTRAISLQQFLLIPERLAESEGLVRPVHVQEPHRVDVEQDSDRVEDGRAEDLVIGFLLEVCDQAEERQQRREFQSDRGARMPALEQQAGPCSTYLAAARTRALSTGG